ncbi:hypothetical protein ACPV5O_02120 [Vibrio maritimus]|uniref:hypothetical protein n=1 Tax=Vibrio maritimus TaxID=990268 RepID=UPI0040691568
MRNLQAKYLVWKLQRMGLVAAYCKFARRISVVTKHGPLHFYSTSIRRGLAFGSSRLSIREVISVCK